MMENGGSLNMCIKGHINHENPLSVLSENPYAFNILRKDVDFTVELIESNNERKYILLRKRYDNTIGYVLFVERDILSIEEMKDIYIFYKSNVERYSNYNYKELEMIIITKRIEDNALEFIEEYNEKYTNRFPISIIINMVEEIDS